MAKSSYIREVLSTRKFVHLNNVLRERSLTLFEKELAYLIQNERGAVLKLSSFFLFEFKTKKVVFYFCSLKFEKKFI